MESGHIQCLVRPPQHLRLVRRAEERWSVYCVVYGEYSAMNKVGRSIDLLYNCTYVLCAVMCVRSIDFQEWLRSEKSSALLSDTLVKSRWIQLSNIYFFVPCHNLTTFIRTIEDDDLRLARSIWICIRCIRRYQLLKIDLLQCQTEISWARKHLSYAELDIYSAAGSFFMNGFLTVKVAMARKKYKITYPTLYAPPGHKFEIEFNSVQRGK